MIKVLVVSTELGEEDTLLGESEGYEAETHDQAVEMGELVGALVHSLAEKVKRESKLVIELAGSVKLTGGAKAEAKFLCFNIGASAGAEHTNTLKMTLETTIDPQNA